MKILMVTPYLPIPGFSGGQTRSYNLIKHLSKKCQITLISFMLPDQSRKHKKQLEKYCRKIITVERGDTWQLKKILFTGFSLYPFLISNYFSAKFRNSVENELKNDEYDLIHVECFYLMPNVTKTDIPVLLVDQTIEFAVYKHYVQNMPFKFLPIKPLLWLDVLKLKFWEFYYWKKSDCLVAVSPEDKQLMEEKSGRKVKIVPNAVSQKLLRKTNFPKYKQPTILFGVANFKWMQNKEGAYNLLKYVWPKIKEQMPEAKLKIAGRYSKQFVESSGLVKPDDQSVEYGEVKNAQEVYSKSWILAAPIRSGGGSRTKFFEAMACGLPIITTPSGIEGIDAENNHQVVVIKDFDQLADKTVELLKNKKKLKRIGQGGRNLIEDKYSWEESAKKLLKIYREIT